LYWSLLEMIGLETAEPTFIKAIRHTWYPVGYQGIFCISRGICAVLGYSFTEFYIYILFIISSCLF
jgi:hypothetical protein